jgi:uncharacterized membrane protein
MFGLVLVVLVVRSPKLVVIEGLLKVMHKVFFAVSMRRPGLFTRVKI